LCCDPDSFLSASGLKQMISGPERAGEQLSRDGIRLDNQNGAPV
jgi:hypothetical protein